MQKNYKKYALIVRILAKPQYFDAKTDETTKLCLIIKQEKDGKFLFKSLNNPFPEISFCGKIIVY